MRKIFLLLILISYNSMAQQVAVLEYGGGGDWYSDPTAVPNLVKFSNSNINMAIDEKVEQVKPDSPTIFQYPYVEMTGHGNVSFSDNEAQNLKKYLLSGGFLHADDNYGMKPYFIEAMKKVFPDKQWKELPTDHQMFNGVFKFPEGLPKIHRHDNKRPQALGLFHEGRLIVLFTVESDISDGWEDPSVHNDPEDVRQKALKMGANIIHYVFTH
jgi:hypothetical protein